MTPDQVNAAVTQDSLQSQPIALFNQETSIGRYSVIQATPTIEQHDILTVMIKVTIPKPIQTVGDAIRHLLRPSGYSLARFDAQGPDVFQLLNLPLPAVHRKLGPMPLQQALLTLASPAFRLYIDPVHRLIAYDLKPDYQLELVP
ncbi:MAG: pili assembly chaperone [Gammaproteobacteria bacterium]|nr:pili assembly chaperone [Gammaproteobacteria bacterium]